MYSSMRPRTVKKLRRTEDTVIQGICEYGSSTFSNEFCGFYSRTIAITGFSDQYYPSQLLIRRSRFAVNGIVSA